MNTISRISSAVRSEYGHHTHILLQSVPRTALPSDIRRAILRAQAVGVSDVAIDYRRFIPSNRAYLTLTHPDHLHDNLNALRNLTVAGIPVFAKPSFAPSTVPVRTRGVKGRSEAAHRGLITGNGPHGGIMNPGKNVVLRGLPGKMMEKGVEGLLKGLGFAGSEGDKWEAVKVEKSDKQFSMFSRFLVRLASVSEAHRLARSLHMTYFEPERWGQKYQIRAAVIY